MLRHVRKLAPQCRRVHDYESLCGQGGQIYGPDHLAMQENGFYSILPDNFDSTRKLTI